MAILPVKGTTSQINNTPILDGQILFETDNPAGQNHIYIDVETNRISVGIYDWNQIENKPFTSVGAGLNVTNGVLNLDSPIVIDWDDITLRPFTSLGDGVFARNGALTTWVQDAGCEWTGTASASGTRFQQITYTINGDDYEVEVSGSKYMQYSQTLSTSVDTVYTFTSNEITTDSIIDIYTSIFDFRPTSVVVSSGSCVITFPPYGHADTSMICRIGIK